MCHQRGNQLVSKALTRHDFTDETPYKQEACASFSDKLPEPHRSLFLWLAALLVEVAKNHHINKMTPGNLGTSFPPLTDLFFFLRIMHKLTFPLLLNSGSNGAYFGPHP